MEQRTFEDIIQRAKESYPMDRKIVNEELGIYCTTGIEMEEINVQGNIKAFTGDIVRVFSKGQPYDENLGVIVHDSIDCPMVVSHEWRIPYLEIMSGVNCEKQGGLNLTSFEIVTHFIEHTHFEPDILEHSRFSPFRFV